MSKVRGSERRARTGMFRESLGRGEAEYVQSFSIREDHGP